MAEEFKQYEREYEVSNFGNIRRKMSNGSYKEVRGSISNAGTGYKYFQTKIGGIRKNHSIHQIVAKLFIGDNPGRLVVDHIDRNSRNNHVQNLRYTTQLENARNTDRYRNDIEEKDPRIRNIILARESVMKIRDLRSHHCCLCDVLFTTNLNLNRHLNGYRHKLKKECKDELGENWKDQYKRWKQRRHDAKRVR